MTQHKETNLFNIPPLPLFRRERTRQILAELAVIRVRMLADCGGRLPSVRWIGDYTGDPDA